MDDDGLYCVSIEQQSSNPGRLLCTGSVDGSIYMLELTEGLSIEQKQRNEKQMISAMFERESKREKNLEARAKELRQKEKKVAEAASGDQGEKTPWEESVKVIEEQFWSMVGGKDAAEEAQKVE